MTNEEYLRRALQVGETHPFIVSCKLAGVEPSVRQVGYWRSGRGRPLEAAWKRWPRSKNLPHLSGARP